MGRIQTFLVELRSRNVLRAAAFYAASSWLVVQIATQVFPFFNIADWVVRWIVIASVVGFPFAVLLSWFYEWTPQGLQRDSDLPADAPARRETGRKLDRAIIVMLALAVIVLVSDRFVRHGDSATPPDKSIAVLPLVNASGDPKDEYFSDGLTDELTAALAQIGGFTVMGRNSSFQFKHSNAGSTAIGEKLGVATLLEGSVRREGSRVRIVAALINAVDGRQLWSQTYDGELDDVFALQSDIARAIADALRVQLQPARGERTVTHHVPRFETYDHFLLGSHVLSHNGDFRIAVSELSQAVALEPTYAEAWANLAMAESFLAENDPNSPMAAAGRRRAMSAAQRAVALDPQLGTAYAARGFLRADSDHDWDGALADLRKSLRLDPNEARNQLRYGYVLAAVGRLREADAAISKGIAHDPLFPPLWAMLSWIKAAQGDVGGARRATQRLLAINPEDRAAATYLGVLALLQGDAGSARAIAAKLDRPGLLAMAEHDLGQSARAKRALDTVIATRSTIAAYQIAQVYAWIGDNDQAFAWLDRAMRQHETDLIRIKYDPLL
ncbi:MAG: hypothetical protein ABIQ62_08745, partial [Thermomonas sp.]